MNRTESGQAVVEVVVVCVLLVVPLIVLLSVVSDVHRAALATTAAARAAGFDAARSADAPAADGAVDAAVGRALLDHRLDPADARVRWSGALGRGAPIEVEVSYPVRVFGVPFAGGASGPSVWVTARHVARVDPYRSRP
ncbi:MAG TPA: hypothetical protein VHJ34_01720 [Actinomycetota bacterium]|nr:hypothetical protein [Actinomycetota bacterium]